MNYTRIYLWRLHHNIAIGTPKKETISKNAQVQEEEEVVVVVVVVVVVEKCMCILDSVSVFVHQKDIFCNYDTTNFC